MSARSPPRRAFTRPLPDYIQTTADLAHAAASLHLLPTAAAAVHAAAAFHLAHASASLHLPHEGYFLSLHTCTVTLVPGRASHVLSPHVHVFAFLSFSVSAPRAAHGEGDGCCVLCLALSVSRPELLSSLQSPHSGLSGLDQAQLPPNRSRPAAYRFLASLRSRDITKNRDTERKWKRRKSTCVRVQSTALV